MTYSHYALRHLLLPYRGRELRVEDRCDEFRDRRGSHFMIRVASDPTTGWARAGALKSSGRRGDARAQDRNPRGMAGGS